MATFTPHDGVAEEDPSAAMAVDSDEEVGQPSSGKEWQIWFDAQLPRGLTLAEYRANVKNVGSLSSLRDLDSYGYYNDFKFVPEEESMATGARKDQDAFRFNLRFFRSSCPPFWEDQPDTAIIYTLQMPPSLAPIDYQLFWKAMTRSLLAQKQFNSEAIVDEDTGEHNEAFNTKVIDGVVVHYGRNKGFGTVEIWCSAAGPSAARALEVVQAIIPSSKYEYRVLSKTRDLAVNENKRIREQAGNNVLTRSKMPKTFEKAESVRRAFQPYDDPRAAPRRTFEKTSGARIAGAGGAAKVEVVKSKNAGEKWKL
ncbi:Eukaryotic translation initiation factor NCBP [Diplonema papillatum]|nr:Eukaryotic translation initiation factor NCBP [Diplonema papillatum]